MSRLCSNSMTFFSGISDRDSGKWNLNPEETYRRRCLLWEIFVYDSWQVVAHISIQSKSLMVTSESHIWTAPFIFHRPRGYKDAS